MTSNLRTRDRSNAGSFRAYCSSHALELSRAGQQVRAKLCTIDKPGCATRPDSIAISARAAPNVRDVPVLPTPYGRGRGRAIDRAAVKNVAAHASVPPDR